MHKFGDFGHYQSAFLEPVFLSSNSQSLSCSSQQSKTGASTSRNQKCLSCRCNVSIPQRNDIDTFTHRTPCNIDEMLVVREKEDLRLLTKFSQHLKTRCGAGVIEINQQIVGDERK